MLIIPVPPAFPGILSRTIGMTHFLCSIIISMDRTISYYNENAEAFIQDTKDVKMDSLRESFLRYIPPGGRILDFGCGSGRDLRYFKDQGYEVSATDASEKLSAFASIYSGVKVRHERFQDLDEESAYDGIWACSSILHLPLGELRDVLERVVKALRCGGVIYTSFKYGAFSGERNGRYFTDMTENTLKEIIPRSLSMISEWITSDARPGREEEKWLNCLLRKKENA